MDIITSGGKLVATQSGPAMVHIGKRYHVVVRSQQFGDDEYDGTLESVQTLDPNPLGEIKRLRSFDFLSFGGVSGAHSDGKGARDFTIHSLRPVD